jgi:hypothetical protein
MAADVADRVRLAAQSLDQALSDSDLPEEAAGDRSVEWRGQCRRPAAYAHAYHQWCPALKVAPIVSGDGCPDPARAAAGGWDNDPARG